MRTTRWMTAALTMLVAVCAMPAISWAADPPKDDRPNIIFIFSDDHAYQAISAYDGGLNQTPNIDRLAEEGMLFKNCVVTNSICGPMRAVIQTGKYSHLNGFVRNGNKFDGSQQTFPKLLQKAGYQTAVVGKWHLATDPQGYDYSEVLIGQGPYYNPPMKKNGEMTKHTGYTTEIISELTLDWLKNQRDPNKPFMLMTQHKAPHRNWQPGPKQLGMYDDVVFKMPETLYDTWDDRTRAAKEQDMSIARTMNPNDLKLTPPRGFTEEQAAAWNACYSKRIADFQEKFGSIEENFRIADPTNMTEKEKAITAWKYQMYMRDYLACIAAVDIAVGELLDYLDESGLAENTIVIYTSDQGFYLGEHGWFDKRFMYEESYKTPFIVRWPGVVKPGTTNNDIVSTLDVPETFLDIAGEEIPSDMQGASLVPVLKGETPDDWRKTIYYHYYEYPGAHSVKRHYGVYDGRHKLIHFYDNIDEWALIDLEADPLEMKSFYNDPAYADVQAKLTKELARLQEELQVPDDSPENRTK